MCSREFNEAGTDNRPSQPKNSRMMTPLSRSAGVRVVVVLLAVTAGLVALAKTTPIFCNQDCGLDSIRGRRRLDSDQLQSMIAFSPEFSMIRYNDPKTIIERSPIESNVIQTNDNPSTYWWKDIDYNQIGMCGELKCFFRSLNNHAVGYLIWEGHSNKFHQKVYTYATNLESQHKIRQFFSSPSFEMQAPDYFKSHLGDHYEKRFLNVESLVIQPSRTAPEGSVIFRCKHTKEGKKGAYDRLDYIIENGTKGWKETLLQELDDTLSLIDYHPELIWDFQLMIDLKGRVYHLDVDRSFRIKGNPKKQGLLVKRCLMDSKNYIGG